MADLSFGGGFANVVVDRGTRNRFPGSGHHGHAGKTSIKAWGLPSFASRSSGPVFPLFCSAGSFNSTRAAFASCNAAGKCLFPGSVCKFNETGVLKSFKSCLPFTGTRRKKSSSPKMARNSASATRGSSSEPALKTRQRSKSHGHFDSTPLCLSESRLRCQLNLNLHQKNEIASKPPRSNVRIAHAIFFERNRARSSR